MFLMLLTLTFINLTNLHRRKHINIFALFDSKSLEAIRLQEIINEPNIRKSLPYDLQEKKSIPTVIYKLGYTVRNLVLNYKDAVNSI